MCDTSSSNYGVSVLPAGTTASGIRKLISLDSGDEILELAATVHVMVANSEVGLQLVYKNSSGTTIGTVADSWSYTAAGVNVLSLSASVPSAASDVEVRVAGLDSSTDVWVDEVNVAAVEVPEIADCSGRAEEKRKEIYAACEADGGTPTGNCTGTADSSMVGGCKIECITNCYKSDDPAQVQCPSGF